MRVLITALILTILVKPASAELVFYCETSKWAITTKDDVRLHEPERFKFLLTRDSVKFAGGIMHGVELTAKYVNLETGFFSADNGDDVEAASRVAFFEPPDLHVALTTWTKVEGYHASCDKF